MASSLDGLGELFLVLPARTCNTTRQDFALLIDKVQQKLWILVVYVLDPALLEEAKLFTLAGARKRCQSRIGWGRTQALLDNTHTYEGV